MPVPPEKKKEIAERLLRGEDVTITMHSEDDVLSGYASGETDSTEVHTEADEPIPGPRHSSGGHDHPHPNGGGDLPADVVIEILGRRIGQMATEIAVLETRLFMFEEGLRSQ